MVAHGRTGFLRLSLLAASVFLGTCHRSGIPCEVAVKRRLWSELPEACPEGRWARWRDLALAFQEFAGNRGDAEKRAKALLGTEVDIDAAYLLGYIYGTTERTTEARQMLQHAFDGHRRSGDHAEASKDAEAMARTYESDFDQSLQWTEIAEEEASKTEDPLFSGRAKRALAENYDKLGKGDEAAKLFHEAADRLSDSPPELAHTYLKHGSFLQDRRSKGELQLALRYYEKAERATTGAKDRFAIRINRAKTLILLNRIEEAEAALESARAHINSAAQEDKWQLVAGHLAANRDQIDLAVSHFNRAKSYEDDYTWEMQLALARAYQRAGHPAKQEAALQEAVAVIESLRTKAKNLELRPWIQANRREPYEELFLLLVAQGRHQQALEIADRLDARTWQDKVPAAARALPSSPPASERLQEPHAELLMYISLGKELWRAHLVGDAISLERLPSDTDKLLEQLADPDAGPQLLEHAAERLLPANLSDDPAPLRIIANGKDMATVPFPALPWRGRPLIFSRSPLRLPTRRARPCTAATQAPVLIADSKGNLPAAKREVLDLAAKLGVAPITGHRATLARLQEARGAQLLHLAIHGKPTESGRALELDDGYVTGATVLRMFDGNAPELVVLSGCATAQNLAPEAWDGLPVAFLAAGSRYVIATLRSVVDEGAAQVMHAYYAQPEHLPPPERLAAAQRQLAGTLPLSVWASFAIWGGDCAEPSSTDQTDQAAQPSKTAQLTR